MYGGDGKVTYALPDLRDRVPMRGEQGAGLTARSQGESGGTETVTLLESEMPVHTHTLSASGDLATATQPAGRMFALGDGIGMYGGNAETPAIAAPQALPPAGGSQPHNNMQPYLTLQFCIALQGIFPARSNPPM
jgi:microcystin-dependent protein